MTPTDIPQVLHRAYRQVTQRDPGDLHRDTDIRALGVDSVQLLEMIVVAETELGLRVPDAALGSVETIGDLYDMLDRAAPQAEAQTQTEAQAGAEAQTQAQAQTQTREPASASGSVPAPASAPAPVVR
ncbi:acyl carrier protein [Streptomyces sp. R1]|uniref:acyl carrier protein n=1 Tax=Streptomyces sp. R1 TaxID=1509279 RepID=UPI001E3C376A|nr:acyl carrier protein [Streptomyces sp. R1]MCC8339482.1 acyl carrier protein [Streptomyces sp. R1]